MEEILRKESEGGIYDVRFIGQEDGSGCHTSDEYVKFKNREFGKRRNWLRRVCRVLSHHCSMSMIYFTLEN